MTDRNAESANFAGARHHQRRRYKPYPAYKSSGIEWLGEIPAHWRVTRLRFTVTKCDNGTWGDEPDGENDVVCVRVADFDRISHKVKINSPTWRAIDPGTLQTRRIRRDDLLLEKSGGGERQPVGAVVRNTYHGVAICSNFIARMPPREGFDARYLTYLHASLYAARINTRSIKQNTGIQNLDSSSYLNERAAIPKLLEQQEIAGFLDRETAKIDALVAKKERLIELFKEKRAALITQAVTKGLDSDVLMKESGVEWFGNVPAHWEVKSLRWAITFQRGHDLPADEREEGKVPLISSSGTSSTHSKSIAEAPGIVTGRYGTVGQFYLVNEAYWPLNTTLYSIDLHGNEPRFLLYMLMHISPRFLFYAVKSAVPGVDRNDIHSDPVALPILTEQRSIARFLDIETAKIDTLTSKVRKAIARLKELRTALISAAVTGKIDVREELGAIDPRAMASIGE